MLIVVLMKEWDTNRMLTFSAANVEVATVFLRSLVCRAWFSSWIGSIALGLRSRSDILDVDRSRSGVPADCLSRRTRAESGFKSSEVQLSVWRCRGMRSFESSLAATVHGTSGGEGEGDRLLTVDLLTRVDMLFRILRGSVARAVEAWVGVQ